MAALANFSCCWICLGVGGAVRTGGLLIMVLPARCENTIWRPNFPLAPLTITLFFVVAIFI